MAPNLSLDRQGSPVLSWLALDGKNAALMFSRLVHGQWSEPNQVAQGTEWFVNRADFHPSYRYLMTFGRPIGW